jgi:Lar family restriction alleviation protein
MIELVEEKLSACPFCGVKDAPALIILGRNHKIICENCRASSGLFIKEQDAINAWNRRIGPSILQGALLRLTRENMLLKRELARCIKSTKEISDGLLKNLEG